MYFTEEAKYKKSAPKCATQAKNELAMHQQTIVAYSTLAVATTISSLVLMMVF